MAKGHLKGPRGELEVAKIVQEWWRNYEPEAIFVRTPGSGGWHGRNQRGAAIRAGHNVSGDVTTSSTSFPFCVEVKRVEDFDMDNLVECSCVRPSPVWKWWLQVQREAGEVQKEPMLWFRQNRKPWMVIVALSYARENITVSPVVTWTTRQLLNINCGASPVMYAAKDLLRMDPQLLARD
jgi:hypothetical protein